MGVDDPLDSSAIHCGSGVLGCLVSGFLAKPQYVMVSRAGQAAHRSCTGRAGRYCGEPEGTGAGLGMGGGRVGEGEQRAELRAQARGAGRRGRD